MSAHARRRHQVAPWKLAPSIRPDLISGRDNKAGPDGNVRRGTAWSSSRNKRRRRSWPGRAWPPRGPPSLRVWWAINDAVLQALGDALERVTRRSGFSEGFRSAITQRRDGTPFLKPDLQAQLIEDEIGEAYFRALAHVDSTV